MNTQQKEKVVLDVKKLHFQQVNEKVRQLVDAGCSNIVLDSVCGHRYIGAALGKEAHIEVNGTAGNDTAMFTSGAEIVVNGSVQDCVGNTMDSGLLVVHGRCGDTLGHGMRGGTIYIRDEVGTRVGIHMKSYKQKEPVLVIGGTAGNFLGEYMAGGKLIVLGITKDDSPIVGRFVGTGMHGGTIYIRGDVQDFQLGKEVKKFDLDDNDKQVLKKYVDNFCQYFGHNTAEIMDHKFIKLQPFTHRPYGNLYAY